MTGILILKLILSPVENWFLKGVQTIQLSTKVELKNTLSTPCSNYFVVFSIKSISGLARLFQ